MFSSGKAVHREPLVDDGLEQGYFTPRNKRVKRKYDKRQRRVAKQLIEHELLQYEEDDDEETTEAA